MRRYLPRWCHLRGLIRSEKRSLLFAGSFVLPLFQSRQRHRVDKLAVLQGGEVQVAFHRNFRRNGIHAAQYLAGRYAAAGLQGLFGGDAAVNGLDAVPMLQRYRSAPTETTVPSAAAETAAPLSAARSTPSWVRHTFSVWFFTSSPLLKGASTLVPGTGKV